MIRQFRTEDAPACSELVRACIRLDSSLPAGVRNSLLNSETDDSMRRRAGLFYIAVTEIDKEVAALGGLELNEIRLLYVSPPYQSRGIGGELLNHLETMVPPGFFRDIFVYATPGAVSFYLEHGFRAGGSYQFTDGGIIIPTVFLSKPVGRGL